MWSEELIERTGMGNNKQVTCPNAHLPSESVLQPKSLPLSSFIQKHDVMLNSFQILLVLTDRPDLAAVCVAAHSAHWPQNSFMSTAASAAAAVWGFKVRFTVEQIRINQCRWRVIESLVASDVLSPSFSCHHSEHHRDSRYRDHSSTTSRSNVAVHSARKLQRSSRWTWSSYICTKAPCIPSLQQIRCWFTTNR